MTEIEPTAWLYTRDDGSKDLVLDCNGEYARALLELGAVETPLFARTRTAPSGDEVERVGQAIMVESRRDTFEARDLGDEIVKCKPIPRLNIFQARLLARAAIAAMRPASGEQYRHVKRGTVYTVIGEAELQAAFDNLVDGSALVLYRGEDGKVWAREEGEFNDGRFTALRQAGEG